MIIVGTIKMQIEASVLRMVLILIRKQERIQATINR